MLSIENNVISNKWSVNAGYLLYTSSYSEYRYHIFLYPGESFIYGDYYLSNSVSEVRLSDGSLNKTYLRINGIKMITYLGDKKFLAVIQSSGKVVIYDIESNTTSDINDNGITLKDYYNAPKCGIVNFSLVSY